MSQSVFVRSTALFLAFFIVGCSSSSDDGPQSTATNVSSGPSASQPSGPSAIDVVSQFLDRVRRGGQNSDAGLLLTQRAQSELKRIGRSVQPIGSPDAKFDVRQAKAVPEEPDSMLVQSIWTEPAPDGTSNDFEVVWAVHRETAGWRISGLAMQVDPREPPIVIDFENGEKMAKLLAGSEEPPATNQAGKPAEQLSR